MQKAFHPKIFARRRSTTALNTLRAFYFRSGKAFPDIDQFVEDTKRRYNIRIVTLRGNVKEACFELKRQNPEIEAVFMGTRKCDLLHFGRQNGLQLDGSTFDMTMKTDTDWPPYLRVYPLLKWDYAYVWDFLVNLRVPYCKLYDEGYTSLGDYNNTAKNPALKFLDESGRVVYKPAYELRDGTLERASRISSPKKCDI
uniref:FAD synthase n=1 Tax=Romanomermis culicivorax TaxID=13658 RepID=A0A915L3F8_ROMCU